MREFFLSTWLDLWFKSKHNAPTTCERAGPRDEPRGE